MGVSVITRFWEYYNDPQTKILRKTGWKLQGSVFYPRDLNWVPPKHIWSDPHLPKHLKRVRVKKNYPYFGESLENCWNILYHEKDPEGEKIESNLKFYLWGDLSIYPGGYLTWFFFDKRWAWFPLGNSVVFNMKGDWSDERFITQIHSSRLSFIMRDLLERGITRLDDQRIPAILSAWVGLRERKKNLLKRIRKLLARGEVEKTYKLIIVVEV